MNAPRVSVLVITYNHAPFVEEALESLRTQTSSQLDVVIIDDASPDGTGELVEQWVARTGFPARVVRNAVNQGICKNRNMGLALTQGEFVCTLAGDDAYEPDRIAHQVAFFEAQPASVGAVYSDAVMVNRHGKVRRPSYLRNELGDEPPPQGRIFGRLLRSNFVCAPAVMLRRSALVAVGGHDESLSYEDYDMWLRLSHRYEFACLPERLVRYRVVNTSMSHAAAGRKRMRASDERILGKWLDADLSLQERDALMDAYWRVAKMHMYMQEDEPAARMFGRIARMDRRPRRRAAGLALQVPQGRAAARRVARIYRKLRGQAEPA